MTDANKTPDSASTPNKPKRSPRRASPKAPPSAMQAAPMNQENALAANAAPASVGAPQSKRSRSRTTNRTHTAPKNTASADTSADNTHAATPAKPARPRKKSRPAAVLPVAATQDTTPAVLDALPVPVPALAQGPATDTTDTAEPRKSRRGRRGGRGRGRKKSAADAPSVTTALADVQASTQGSDIIFEQDTDTPPALPMQDAPTDTQSTARKSPRPPKTSKQAAHQQADESTTHTAPAKTAEKSADKATAAASRARRKMFVSVLPGEQVEVALVEDAQLLEYYLEMQHQAKIKGNIYKGIVSNVDANLQAAFVNYGAVKNGFLQIDEIHPEYYLAPHEAAKGKKFPPIQKIVKPGQEVLVQVVKEPTGNKGAFLTTWLSLAGRFLVLTPGQEQVGVSRKVDNDEERARLRELISGIEPGEGLGVIVRTVSAGTSKTTLKNDLQYLKRVWKEIRKRGTAETAPALIYQEFGLAERAMRDYLTDEVCEVWVDNAAVADSLRETAALLFPRKNDLVRIHSDVRQTLWERFNIHKQIDQISARDVYLPSGGRLVFDQTEALMAIDINSGKISGKGNFETMALRTNMEAAETIARHLRLRDIGGQIVIDFIEMRDKNHVRDVEKTLRNAMKNDRARHDVGRMSSFGLLEIVRQRTGSSALAITMEPCPTCKGTGLRRNMEWQAMQALRELDRNARASTNGHYAFESTTELGMYLLNHKRDRLREMEHALHVHIEIRLRP